MADPTPGEVPNPQPAPPAGEPVARVTRVSAPPPAERPTPKRSTWNPLAAPLSWIFFALQIGLFAVAAYRCKQANYQWENPGAGPIMHALGLLDVTRITTEPWRLFACLFLETLGIQLLLNSWLFFSMGPELERMYKSIRFGILYLIGGLCCVLTTDILAQFAVFHMSTDVGAGARHAIFCCYGSVVGLIAATEGFKAAATSRFVWGRIGWILGVVVLSYLLQGPGSRFGVGVDVGRWITDLVVGAIFGYALALTLHGGLKKVIGILFTLFLVVVTVGEVGFFAVKSYVAPPDIMGFPNSGNGPDTPRKSDEVATPRPTLPDDADPKEIAGVRGSVAEFLEGFGPLPEPAKELSDQKAARRMIPRIENVETHFNSSASANLEAERAELYLIADSLVKAKDAAEKGNLMMIEKGLTPGQIKGSKRANRIARCYGVQAIVALQGSDPDFVGAQALLNNARDWDPMIPEVHYFLGKLSNDPKWSKDELETFLNLVGTPREYQQDRVAKARQALGR